MKSILQPRAAHPNHQFNRTRYGACSTGWLTRTLVSAIGRETVTDYRLHELPLWPTICRSSHPVGGRSAKAACRTICPERPLRVTYLPLPLL